MPELTIGDRVQVRISPGRGLIGRLFCIEPTSSYSHAVDFGANLGWTHNCFTHLEASLPENTGFWYRPDDLEPAPTDSPIPTPTERTCEECGETLPLTSFPNSTLNRRRCWTNICLSCAENMTTCSFCSRPTPNNDIQYDEHENEACPDCAGDMWVCQSCGLFTNYGEYCEDCDNSENDEEPDYSNVYFADYKPCPRFYPEQTDPPELYLGVELETDKYPDSSAKVSACKQLDHVQIYLKADGSLVNGVEIVSHPATLHYHLNTLPWADIIKIVKDNGGQSHNARTCGIHVHFNKDFFDPNPHLNTLKLINLSRKFWKELVIFSRREQEELNSWAHPYSHADDFTLRKNLPDKIRRARDYGKYSAFNISNHDTIEIRIFRGTLLLDSFFACLEMVDALVRFAKKQPIASIERITWKGFTQSLSKKKYPYLVSYLRRKELCA